MDHDEFGTKFNSLGHITDILDTLRRNILWLDRVPAERTYGVDPCGKHQFRYKCENHYSTAFFYDSDNQTCLCTNGPPSSGLNVLTGSRILFGHVVSSDTTLESGTYGFNHKLWFIVTPSQQDCLDLYHLGYTTDGVYTIRPPGATRDSHVWCDMTNGGWTVIQHRLGGFVEFDRNWADYVDGFGYRTYEYWLGLEAIHMLTSHSSELQIELETFGDAGSPNDTVVGYSIFHVDDALTNYTMTAGGFSGGCGDCLIHHTSQPFTTIDRDNDQKLGGNCAVEYSGGWWYSQCCSCNLNGHYYGGWVPNSETDGVTYNSCWPISYSLKKTVMKIRRV